MDAWLPFLFQHIVGGLIFLFCFAVAWRGKDHSLRNIEDRAVVGLMFLIFFVYLIGNLLWQLYGLGWL